MSKGATDSMELTNLTNLMQKLQYRFSDKKLLEMALTHPSYGAEHGVEHYQRLEFLGDAVLELAVSRFLYAECPDLPEGRLTRIRAALVREESLYEAARGFGLGQMVRLSAGEERSGGRDKPSILSDVMEAVIAATYLDGGIDAAFELVRRALGERLLHPDIGDDPLDYKTRLQELVQQDGGPTPTYEMVSQGGPPHLPRFSMRVMLGDEEIGRGNGQSKRAAQQQAAQAALAKMNKL